MCISVSVHTKGNTVKTSPYFQPQQAGFDLRSGHTGFVMGSDTMEGFLQVFWFPLPILILPTASHPLIIMVLILT
jgi:hypothetical protein